MCGHTGDPLDSQHWVSEVVENASKKDDVKFADPFGSKVVDIQQHVLHFRPQHAAREVETFFRSPPFARPDEFVNGEDTTGTTAFRLKGESPIPSANVEHRFAA